MSIIHDALKKVQKNLSEDKPVENTYLYAPESTKENPKKDIEPPSSAQNTKNILTIFICLIITLACLYFITQQFIRYAPQLKEWMNISYFKIKHSTAQTNQDRRPLEPLAQLSTTQSTAEEESPQTLKIHGVMSQGKNNLVLINDKVYQEGDTLKDIQIKKINLNSIVVLKNGQEEIIPVKK